MNRLLAIMAITLTLLTQEDALAQNIDVDDKDVHVVSAVIRYYASEGKWRALESQNENHPTINVSSVTSDSSTITINYDTTGWGTVSPSTVIAVVDETLAREGLFVGASGGRDKAVLQLGLAGVSDYIRYDGSQWIAHKGRFTNFSWSDGKLIMYRPGTGITRNGAYPSLTPRETPYSVTLGSIGQDTIQVIFYDEKGNQVSTPDTSMKFFITDPAGAIAVDPNGDFADKYGNIWFLALMVETGQ